MHETAMAGQGGGAECAKQARDKTWSECSIEEKIDRLRIVLRVTNERATHSQRLAIEALDTGRRHEHGGQGQVVMPVPHGMNSPLANPLAMIGNSKSEAEGDYFSRLLS